MTAIIACIWGTFILSLFVIALDKTTRFSDEEQDAYDEIIKQTDIQTKLRSEAGYLVKNFLVLTLLRKFKIDEKRRSMLLLRIFARGHRFHFKRMNIVGQEETLKQDLEHMRDTVEGTMKVLRSSLDIYDEIETSAEEVMDNQKELEQKVRKSLKYSNCILNLASLLIIGADKLLA